MIKFPQISPSAYLSPRVQGLHMTQLAQMTQILRGSFPHTKLVKILTSKKLDRYSKMSFSSGTTSGRLKSSQKNYKS